MKQPNVHNINFNLIRFIGFVFFFGIFNQVISQDFNFNYAKAFGGNYGESTVDMAVDESGNVVLLGYFNGMIDFDPSPAENIKESVGSTDIFVAKFDSNGHLLWVHTFGSYEFENPGGIDFDNNGNVIFSGTLNRPLDVDPSPAIYTLSNAGTSNGGGTGMPSQQGFVVKLSPEGNFIWANYAPAYFGTSCQKLEVDNNNEIVFTKSFYACCGGSLQESINKLSSTGVLIWSQTIGPPSLGYQGYLSINELEISNQNEILFCGNFSNNIAGIQNTVVFQSPNATYTAAGSNGHFLLKLDSNGELILGQSNQNGFTSIAIDNSGNFFISSSTSGPVDINPSPSETFIVGASSPQRFIAKYSNNGNFIWARTFDINNTTNFGFTDISISSQGELFLSGPYNGTIDFNPSPTETSISTVSTYPTSTIALLRLNQNGDYISKRIVGIDLSYINPVVGELNNNDEYFIAGTFKNSIEFNPNQEFNSSNGLLTSNGQPDATDIFFSKFSTCVPPATSAIITPAVQNLCVNANIQPLELNYTGPDSANYQWYWSSNPNNTDGTLIPGATANTFSPSTSFPIDKYYYCKASINTTGCSLNSHHARVTVINAPNITSQAIANQSVCADGVPLPLSISTSNPAGIDTYQWYSNSVNSNSGGVLIPGATSNSFTPVNTSVVGSTYYYCVVCGVTATNAFRINVVADPIITSQPEANQTICIGGNANVITSNATGGTGILSYQWFNADTNTAISGSNSNSYAPTSFTSIGSYNYYLKISQSGLGCNTLYSTNSTITVIADPFVSASPASQSICTNGSVSPLEVSSSGGVGTISYQWYRTTNNSNAGGTAISGANSASYLPPTSLASNYYYYAAVYLSGSGCSANSPTSLVAVNPAPSFSAQPIASQTVCVDGTPSALNVNYSNGAGAPVYQWWSNNVNSTNNATLISGASSASFIPNSSTVGTTYYFCTVTFSASNCGFITSNFSSVTVISDPIIAWHPIGSIICVGGEANPLSVDVSGGVGTYTYQWYNSATGNPIASATSALFYPGTFNTPSENSYYVQINQSGAGCDALTSSPALVSVVEDPTLTSNSPSYQIICEQSNIDSLEILVLGGTQLSYQWFIASNSTSVGNPISNATSLSFTPSINSVSNNFYYCQMSSLGNGCTPSINSTPIQIEIVGQPQITNSAYSVEACQNNTMPSLEIAGNYDTNPVIHFFQSNTIDTYDGSELSSTNFTPSSSELGNYSYYFTYNVDYPGCLADTSGFYNVTISDIPAINISSNEPLIGCSGAEIELTNTVFPNLTSDYILVWNLDNSSSDTTYASNVFSTLPIETAGNHNMQVQMLSTLDYCSAIDELNLSINIVPDPSITEEQNFIQSLCPFDEEIDAPTMLLDFDNLIGPPTYIWNQVEQGVIIPIPNSNQNSYLPQLPLHGIFNSQGVIAFDYPGCDILTSSLSTLTFDDNNLDCFPEVIIPEAISPNNDGMNDFWTIQGIEQFNGYEINIFNSFGQSIYFVKNIPPNWDGMWNGQTLPNGDYFYAVNLIELNRTVFGTISIAK
jgi:gliding motility-associated-like protein